jgi:hypothetical protein
LQYRQRNFAQIYPKSGGTFKTVREERTKNQGEMIMPYVDPERRRQFHREYKRRWRAKKKKISPFLDYKIYLCVRFPTLHLPGGTSFFNSFLITNNPKVQAQVEQHDLFGRDIFPLALDLSLTVKEEE